MNRPRILIVEDDALIAGGLAADLDRSGITHTRTTMSGQGCLDAIREERPDLVILDIEMPGGMDGIETAARIRSEYGLPFIFLTAYSNESLVERAKETAPYGYILKPYRPTELRIAIDMALHRHDMERRIDETNASLEREMEERRRADAALRRSEEKYRDLVEHINDVIFKMRKDGTILFVSGAVEQMFGYLPGDLVGRTFTEIIYVDDLERMTRVLGDVIAGNLSPSEYRVKTGTGGIRWVRSSSRPYYENGEPAGIQGVLSDISLRKWAEEELRSSHERLVATLNALPDIMFEIDAVGRILDYRTPENDILYVPPDAFLGKKMTDVLPEDAGNIIAVAIDEAKRNRQFRGAIYSLPMPGGARWFEMSIAAKGELYSPDYRLIMLARDITNRKILGDELKESEQKLMAIVQGSPIPQFIIGNDHRVMFWNKALEMISGYDSSSMVGTNGHWKAFYDLERPCMADLLIDGEMAAGIIDWYPGICRESAQIPGAYECIDFFPILGDNGRWIHFTSALLRNTKGDIIGAVETLQDITGRKSAEMALQASERRYRELVENANSIILRMDKRGTVTFFNEFAETFFGFTRDEIIGRSVIGTIVPGMDSSGTDLAEMIMNITSDPDRYRYNDNENMKKSGERVWVSWTNKVIKEDEDHVAEVLCIGTDITERRRSEQRFRELYENLRDGSAEVDLAGNFIECNNRYLDMAGYTAEEMCRMSLKDISPEQHHEMEMKILNEQFLARGYSDIYEKELLRKDGTRFPVELQAYLKKGPDGKPAGYWALVRDISRRKNAELELSRSEKKYRELADFLPEIIFEVDESVALTYVNRAVFPLLGYTKEEVASVNVFDFFIPEERDRCLENFMSLKRGERGSGNEYTMIRKDGSRLPVIMYSRAKKSDGVFTGVRGIIVDITEIRRMETAFRESEAKFHSLFADSGDAQILMDTEQVLDCNDAAVTMMGCTERIQMIGRNFQEFCPEIQPDGEYSFIKRERYTDQALAEKSIRFEWQHRRMDGGLFYAEVVLTAIFIEGRTLLHATLRDVTERSLLQDQIITIVDVEQQRLGQNLHDGLGQDLTGVAFLSNSLTRRLKELGLDEAVRSEEVTSQVYRVITLVRTLSRELYPPNLVENEITYTLADFASNIEKTFGITCIYEQDRDLQINNLNTSTQIYYVTREAVNNAIRHGNAHNILIKLTGDADRVILMIKDDGAGLPEKTDERAGLGLKIMAYRMESIHGTFGIRRDTGGGTVITCTMPMYMTKKVE